MLVNLPGLVRLLIKESKLRLLPFALTGRAITGKCMFGDEKVWPVIYFVWETGCNKVPSFNSVGTFQPLEA